MLNLFSASLVCVDRTQDMHGAPMRPHASRSACVSWAKDCKIFRADACLLACPGSIWYNFGCFRNNKNCFAMIISPGTWSLLVKSSVGISYFILRYGFLNCCHKYGRWHFNWGLCGDVACKVALWAYYTFPCCCVE